MLFQLIWVSEFLSTPHHNHLTICTLNGILFADELIVPHHKPCIAMNEDFNYSDCLITQQLDSV